MTTPILGAPELVAAQATPETTVNEMGRYFEQGAHAFVITDRDLSTPAGGEADGSAYIVAGTGTGDWAGHDGDIAFKMSTAWEFINIAEGMSFWIADENKFLVATSGSTFTELAAAGGSASTTQTGEMIAGFIATPSDKSYTLAIKMAHAGTITETTTISASGTCTATFKINTTALGGTANSVSSSEQSQAHASNNAFSAGDDIVLTVSSNSTCVDLSFSIKYTRTLA